MLALTEHTLNLNDTVKTSILFEDDTQLQGMVQILKEKHFASLPLSPALPALFVIKFVWYL